MLFKKSENHGFSRYICLLLLLVIFLACSLFLAVSLGSVTIDIQDTYQIIFSKLGFSFGTSKLSPSTIAIVWNMRVPRVLLGILAGAGPDDGVGASQGPGELSVDRKSVV